MKQIILEGIKQIYFADKSGIIYRQTKSGLRPLKTGFSNNRDKHLSVKLQKQDGGFMTYYVYYLILLAYKKYKGTCFRVSYIDGDNHNNSLSNLEQTLRSSICFWDVLTDEEFNMWSNKISSIKFTPKIKKFNDKALLQFKHNICRINSDIEYRHKFFKKLFAI